MIFARNRGKKNNYFSKENLVNLSERRVLSGRCWQRRVKRVSLGPAATLPQREDPRAASPGPAQTHPAVSWTAGCRSAATSQAGKPTETDIIRHKLGWGLGGGN